MFLRCSIIKIVFLASWLIIISLPLSFAQNVQDVKLMIDNYNKSYSVNPEGIIDEDGNVFIVGDLQVIYDMDPSNDTFLINLNNPPNSVNRTLVISKYSKSGELLWINEIKRTSGLSSFQGSIDIDANGNLYVFGMGGAEDFDLDPNSIVRIDSNYNTSWIAKYNGSNGYLEWINEIRSDQSSTFINDIQYDPITDAVYLVGDLENKPIVFCEYDNPKDSIAPTSASNLLLIKYNSSGDYKWAKHTNGIYGQFGESLTTLTNGDIIITGSFVQQADFSLDTINSSILFFPAAARKVGFAAKYDSAGIVKWSNMIGSFQDDEILEITSDQYENIYLTGYIGGDANFDFSGTNPDTVQPNFIGQRFVVSYDSQNTLRWLKFIDGNWRIYIESMNCTDDGKLLLGGAFQDKISFGANDSIEVPHNASFPYDGFAAILSSSDGESESLMHFGEESVWSLVTYYGRHES